VRNAASRIEALDHAGAGLAALFGAVLFVPILGLGASGVLLALMQGLALMITRLYDSG
jgi:hypothetical protein